MSTPLKITLAAITAAFWMYVVISSVIAIDKQSKRETGRREITNAPK